MNEEKLESDVSKQHISPGLNISFKEICKIYFLKLCCNHDWEIFKQNKSFEPHHDRPYKVVDIWVCKKCGKLKKFTFRA